jgi:hypothetical protein
MPDSLSPTFAQRTLMKFNEKPNYWPLVYILLLAASIASLWIPSYLPTQDGPQHLRLNAFLIEMRLQPASPLNAVFVDALGFRTTSLFSWFCLLCQPFFSIEITERLFVSLSIAGFGWVVWLCTRRIHPGSPARVLVIAPFFINWFTTMGFLSYFASIPLAGGAVYLLFKEPQGERSRMYRAGKLLLAALLLLVGGLGHMAAVLVALFLALLLATVKKNRDLFISVALAFLPALILGIVSISPSTGAVTAHQTPQRDIPQFQSILFGFTDFLTSMIAGVGPIDTVLQGAMMVLVLALLVTGAAQLIRLRRPMEGQGRPAELSISLSRTVWPLCLISVLLLGLGVLPIEIMGWTYASTRLIPFMLLLLPAAVAWPAAGSITERRVCMVLSISSLLITGAIGCSWFAVGNDLKNVAGAARVMQPGTRVLPLTFSPGEESPWLVREAGPQIHAWAIPARLSRLMVSFGFENMQRMMVYGRADARPPLPEGPNEFIGPIVWTPGFRQTPRVFAEARMHIDEITDAARFLAPGIRDPQFLQHLGDAVLDQAVQGFHYLLLIHPPKSLLHDVRTRELQCLYEQQGIYVYRLSLPLDRFVIQGLNP